MLASLCVLAYYASMLASFVCLHIMRACLRPCPFVCILCVCVSSCPLFVLLFCVHAHVVCTCTLRSCTYPCLCVSCMCTLRACSHPCLCTCICLHEQCSKSLLPLFGLLLHPVHGLALHLKPSPVPFLPPQLHPPCVYETIVCCLQLSRLPFPHLRCSQSSICAAAPAAWPAAPVPAPPFPTVADQSLLLLVLLSAGACCTYSCPPTWAKPSWPPCLRSLDSM